MRSRGRRAAPQATNRFFERALVFALTAALVGCRSGSSPAGETATSVQTPSSPSTADHSTSGRSPHKESAAHSNSEHSPPPSSTSLRNPNDGSLEHGVALPLEAPGLRFNPKRDPRARYATAEVVNGLLHAAATVHRFHRGMPITVNDLSYERGGPIPRHGSHQSGRDVDVLFYQLGPDGQPIDPVGAFFDKRGIGVDFKELSDRTDDVVHRIDFPRTWRFLQALIEDDRALLQRIFVAEHLRTLLLHEAKRQGAPKRTVQRFSDMTCQPSYPHDDHLHLRFFCTAEDIGRGCRDSEPVYPWRAAQLDAQGVKSLPLLEKRPQARSATVSHRQARAEAGPMNTEVKRWLARRKKWIKPPRTGRRLCR